MREELIAILKENIPGVDFETARSLVDGGILESLDIVTIVPQIIDAFDIELSVEDLLPENFNSVDAMVALIESKK